MDSNTREMLDKADEVVQRANEENFSSQPRFNQNDGESIAGFFLDFFSQQESEIEPAYSSNSRTRDTWLRNFVKKEPHLDGVLKSVVDIDKNRSWALVGGRNQVIRFTGVMHSWEIAPALRGWRPGVSAAASSYYQADIGSIIEVGREGPTGPVRGLYHTDPVRCQLTGKTATPLKYTPGVSGSKSSEWEESDFMRVVSMPSIDESMRGLGWCAISRLVTAARLMVAVYRHDSEQLADKAPRGLLLMNGISEAQWRNALKARQEENDSLGYRYFSPVMVLAGVSNIDAKMIALSQLPANFDIKVFTDLLMYTYALAFGYDPTEFWPVQFGALGRGRESEVQAKKATGKGGQDFMLSLQEQFQRDDILPPTLHFEFGQRDQEHEIIAAQLNLTQSTVIKTLRETGIALGEPLLSWNEARTLLANYGIIPMEWTEIIESSESTDAMDVEDRPTYLDPQDNDEITSDEIETLEAPKPAATAVATSRQMPANKFMLFKKRMSENPRIIRAALRNPKEPIVRYTWPDNRMETLWETGSDLTKRQSYPSASVTESPFLKREISRPRQKTRAKKDKIIYASNGKMKVTENDLERIFSDTAARLGDEAVDILK